jgi:hypothetical protein
MPDWLTSLVLAALIVAIGVWWRHRSPPKQPVSPKEAARRKFRVVEGGLKETPENRDRTGDNVTRLDRSHLRSQPGSKDRTGPDKQ